MITTIHKYNSIQIIKYISILTSHRITIPCMLYYIYNFFPSGIKHSKLSLNTLSQKHLNDSSNKIEGDIWHQIFQWDPRVPNIITLNVTTFYE